MMRFAKDFFVLLAIIFLVRGTNADNGLGFQHFCGSEIDQPWCIPRDYDHNVDPFYYHNLSEFSLPWNFTYDFWVNKISRIDDKFVPYLINL